MQQELFVISVSFHCHLCGADSYKAEIMGHRNPTEEEFGKLKESLKKHPSSFQCSDCGGMAYGAERKVEIREASKQEREAFRPMKPAEKKNKK